MERYQIILFFAILSFAGWDANSLSIKRIIKRVGIRIKFYPAHYIMPSKKMRKIFKLEKKEIPKWMCFSLSCIKFDSCDCIYRETVVDCLQKINKGN